MDILGLFPQPIARVSLGRKLTDEEFNCIMSQPLRPNFVNAVSNNFKILDCPELKQIKAFCAYHSERFFEKVYMPMNSIKSHITLSWTNYNKKNDWVNEHNHSNSIISGVFYVKTQESDGLMIRNDPPYKQLSWVNREDTPWNSEIAVFQAVEGELLLFRSDLKHNVMPEQHDGVRVSLAFNTWISGEIGDDLSALTL
jgi:uncharacterized protein (TIGR02466 family)